MESMLSSIQSKCEELLGSKSNESFIFPDCKYSKWYWDIVEKREHCTPEGYTEKHHIIPKFMGGTNDSKNIVRVTGREHYILHLLLMRICEINGDSKIYGKSVYSVMCFTMKYYHKDRYIIPSRSVEMLRKRLGEVCKGKPSPNKGIPLPEEVKQKMRNNHYLKRGGIHPMFGNNHTEESINKMRNSRTKFWWDVYSPSGEYFYKVAMNDIIRRFDLNIDCIRRFIGKVIPDVSPRTRKQAKQSRINSTGWLFIPL